MAGREKCRAMETTRKWWDKLRGKTPAPEPDLPQPRSLDPMLTLKAKEPDVADKKRGRRRFMR